MTNIGITGATGFLGSYVLGHLAGRTDCRVRALDRVIRSELVAQWPTVAWQRGDLASERDCADFAKGLDVIIHFAHTNTPLNSNRHLPSDASLNLVPTLTLLEVVRGLRQSPHIIYASSGGAMYGRAAAPPHRPFRESDPCRPVTSYSIQKLAAEHYLRLGAEKGWLRATCLRIGNPYGVLLPPERRQGLIGVLLNQIVHGKPVTVFGDPSNVRDYIHLADLARLITMALGSGSRFDVFNVGSGRGHSVQDILGLLARIHGRPLTVDTQDATAETEELVPWIVLDVTKSKRDLGWEPQIGLEDGLTRLYRESVAATAS